MPVAVPAELIVYVPLAVDVKPVGILKPANEGPLLVAPPANADGLRAYPLAITLRLFKSDARPSLFDEIAFALKSVMPTETAMPTIITPSTIKRSCCCPILLSPYLILLKVKYTNLTADTVS